MLLLKFDLFILTHTYTEETGKGQYPCSTEANNPGRVPEVKM